MQRGCNRSPDEKQHQERESPGPVERYGTIDAIRYPQPLVATSLMLQRKNVADKAEDVLQVVP